MYGAKSIAGYNFHLVFPVLSDGSAGVYKTLHVADTEVSQGPLPEHCFSVCVTSLHTLAFSDHEATGDVQN